MRKQNVIIFSSGKSKDIAHKVARHLNSGKGEAVTNAVVWDEFFDKIYGDDYSLNKSYALFPFLLKKIPSFDYAIIVAGADDRMRKNDSDGQEFITTRDNVIFELGLCSMALGEKRVIILHHEGVRLIDDLRGYSDEAQKAMSCEDTVLSSSNAQLKTIDYNEDTDFALLAKEITSYILRTYDDYSPVVVGAACSTALGYMENFLSSFSNNVKKTNFEEPNSATVDGKDSPKLRYLLSQPEKVEIHVLLPSLEAVENNPLLLSDTRAFLSQNLYGKNGTLVDCKINCGGRPIGFCCKLLENKVIVIDLPTTLLASKKTAQKVLDIKADDAIEKDHLSRILAKEIDQFRCTMEKFLFHGKNGVYHLTAEDAQRGINTIFIDEISFNEPKDKQYLPWLTN